jgi:hypothetical protein
MISIAYTFDYMNNRYIKIVRVFGFCVYKAREVA